MSFSATVASFYSSITSQSELLFCVKNSLPSLGSRACLNVLKTFCIGLQDHNNLVVVIVICILAHLLLKTENFLGADPCLCGFLS